MGKIVVHARLPDDADAFGRSLESHRRDLLLLCYRFLGSIHEAEEAVQETSLRAWRGRASFRGESTIRTWLHRIASRVCLDALERRARRVLPSDLAGPARPSDPPDRSPNDIPWLEPIPDELIADAALDPAARYSLHESISLAFVAALQALPPRQRAVLILRDVLALSSAETADALDMTLPAADSALHRARSTLAASHHRTGLARMPAAWPSDPEVRRLLDAYVRAWESDDVDGLVATLRDEVRLAMPPSPSWYRGRDVVVDLLRRWVFPQGPFRMRLTAANGQPAALLLAIDDSDMPTPMGVQVLTIEDGGIIGIDVFMDPQITARFAAIH
jgi:RNA polymerase sigma-70 factor (ECF subfamily)